MGQAKLKRRARALTTIEEIEEQGGDLIQVPLQQADGCFRGIQAHWMPDLLDYWRDHANGRTLWVYRVDKFWAQHFWETPKGNRVLRHEQIVEVKVNQELKDMWLRTVSQPGVKNQYALQIEETLKGENGHVVYWAFLRYIMSHSKTLSSPVNCWEYFPIVEVHHPDGRVEESAIDVTHFADGNRRTIRHDHRKVNPAAPWEKRLFDKLITAQTIEVKE